MPYVPPGPSSQSCLPRKAIASTVLEQTRRKAAAAGKTSRPSSSSSGGDGGPKELNQIETSAPSSSISRPGVDMSAATSQLANQLEAASLDDPAITIPKTCSSSSLAPSSNDATSTAVSPTLSTSTKSSDSEDAVSAYKAALYTYTVSRLSELGDFADKVKRSGLTILAGQTARSKRFAGVTRKEGLIGVLPIRLQAERQ